MISKIRQIISPKIQIYDDIFEKSKYLLSYRLTLFLSFALFVLSIVLLLFFALPHFIMTFIGFMGAFSSFLFLYRTGRYKTIIFTFNLVGAALCIITLFYVQDLPRIVDGFWMIISSMFAFLTLGKRWGTIITITHGLVLSTFFFFFLEDQILRMREMNSAEIGGLAFNVVICFLLIFYLNWQNIKTNKDAEIQILTSNADLENQLTLINKQNQEKTVLLKEIHHRVKNNLQVIVSLLRLQSRDIENENELSKFDESINRVLAMSLIHEKIYQTDDFSNLNMTDYFKTLSTDMINSFQIEKRIDFSVTCDVNSLGLKPIVPLALIFNELLSNSIKYAFKNTECPKIKVEFFEKDNEKLEFIYHDNGKWLEKEKNSSFGCELIDALTDQLNGNFSLEKTNGTKYHFYFERINA
jgi:two-component sensor histidine kinase